MDRRDFMKTTGTLLAGVALSKGAIAQAAGLEEQGRLVLPINRGWRYSPSFVPGGHDLAFDDSKFDCVVVPHTNIALPWHSFDEKSYEFVSLYRRRFKLPAEARGHRVFVDFEGVMTACTVWINGQRLGEYKGGYTPFSFDLTPYVNFDGDNVLAVDVDSSERPDVPPFGHQIDYLTFGGIYREVALRIVLATFIENIFARPKDVLSKHPSLDVECFVQRFEASGALTLEAVLLDGKKVVGKTAQKFPPRMRRASPQATHWNFPRCPALPFGAYRARIFTPSRCGCWTAAALSMKPRAASVFAKPSSPIMASRSTERSSSCAGWIVTRHFLSSARRCPGACSAATPGFCAKN